MKWLNTLLGPTGIFHKPGQIYIAWVLMEGVTQSWQSKCRWAASLTTVSTNDCHVTALSLACPYAQNTRSSEKWPCEPQNKSRSNKRCKETATAVNSNNFWTEIWLWQLFYMTVIFNKVAFCVLDHKAKRAWGTLHTPTHIPPVVNCRLLPAPA